MVEGHEDVSREDSYEEGRDDDYDARSEGELNDNVWYEENIDDEETERRKQDGIDNFSLNLL